MRLAEMMEQTGTTQQELADYLGVSRVAISQYATGKREPDLAALVRIAEFFQVSLDYLAERTSDETPKSRVPHNYVEINEKVIKLRPGDSVTVHIGERVFSFTVQEIEI